MATLVVNRPDTSNGGFAQIPNEWLRDTRLSLIARAILAILATHNTGFEVQTEDFYGLGTGKETVAKAFRELESVGYLTRTKGRSSQGTWVHTWTLNPNAGHAPDPGKPSVDVTSDNTPSPQVSTSDGSPGPGQPGRNKKTTSKKTKNTPPPTPTSNGTSTSVEAKGREGDSFQEFMELLPSSKRKNPLTAQSIFAETINSGITAREVIDGTRAYVERENNRDDEGRGGKFISQAVAILEGEKWRTPILSTAEAIKEAGRLQRQMRDLRAAGDEDGAMALFESKLNPLTDKHGLVPDEWNLGYKKRSTFDPTKWML